MIAAVILAAGASSRLGRPKQLVTLSGETLLERVIRAAREAGCAPIVVILGANRTEILANIQLGDALHAINDQWREGVASSIRLGVHILENVAKEAGGVLLMACDQPAVTASHLRLLIIADQVRASRYAGRNGVPAYFPRKHFAELMGLTGDAGARTLLAHAPSEELVHGELDIDTAEDLARARELFRLDQMGNRARILASRRRIAGA
jgi:CTP:molybdopterin cytidylyltransferase MocA